MAFAALRVERQCRSALTLDAFLGARHILIASMGTGHQILERALADALDERAGRGGALSDRLELPDGSRMEIFGSGGGEAVSDALTKTLGARVPLLGQIPLDTRLREAGDAGAPIVLAEPDSPAAQALEKIADGLAVRSRGLAGMSLNLTPVKR